MNKKDLILNVAKWCPAVKASSVEAVINQTFLIMAQALENGEEINLRGFGKFEIKQVKPRPCFDFKTKKAGMVPAHKKIVFTPGEILKEAAKNG